MCYDIDIMENDKIQELLNDAKGACGCYEQGDYCYNRQGNPTHSIKEECNE